MSYWIAKAKGSYNAPFENWIKKGRLGHWHTKKLPKKLGLGDRLIIWKTSPDLKVVGFAEVTKIPIPQRTKNKIFEVRYLTDLFLRPVGIQRLKRESPLKGAAFLISGPSGTLFPLSPKQAACVIRLAKDCNLEIRNLWKDISESSQIRHQFEVVEPKTIPSKIIVTTERIIRNTKASGDLKEVYENHCQVCNERIQFEPDIFYSEVHHIRPLGGKHRGRDAHSNMLVVCPNHHAMFDFGIPYFISPSRLRIADKVFPLTLKHQISRESVNYHNSKIWKGHKR
jgi:hypothetical protein